MPASFAVPALWLACLRLTGLPPPVHPPALRVQPAARKEMPRRGSRCSSALTRMMRAAWALLTLAVGAGVQKRCRGCGL